MADISIEKQKVKEITDKLEEGLKELFESEKYRSYLSTMSKFHNYSVNNTLLIALQKPEATLVAGYQAWKKKFDRHVNKGEKGIRILAPAPYIIKEERDKLDPVTGEPMLDKDGTPQTEVAEVRIPAFRVVSVFDVSQTDGEPIPELEVKELLATVEGYEDFVEAVTYVSPAPISFEDIPGSSRGYFEATGNRIAVQEGMSESQTLKTMVHETAHAMLHNKEVNKDVFEPVKDRNTKEVEAESIAFTVCNHFGIDTSDYSFGYIAGWSSGRNMVELKASLDTIRRTASEIITGIEERIQEIQRDRDMVQEQGALLLVQNNGLNEYSLIDVKGMDMAEIADALLAMNEDDKLNVTAYLESKGAWAMEIANEETREYREYRLDIRYNKDTNEVTNVRAEMEKKAAAREELLLRGDADRYGIYQLKDNPELRDFHFAGTAELLKRGILSDVFKEIQPGNYNLVYSGELSDIRGQTQDEKLNDIFEKFNIDHPADYRGHSLSVSDVVVFHVNGKNSALFVDSFGFKELPDFMRALEGARGQQIENTGIEEAQDNSGKYANHPEIHDDQNQNARQTEKKSHPAFYGHTMLYAYEHKAVGEYLDSSRIDRECKKAIEETIQQHFDGMHLEHDIVKPLIEQFGAERLAFVLANTIQKQSWDGRFSRANKAWASEFQIPEDLVRGIDINQNLVVSSHPAVLDGFINMFRNEALEKEISAGQEKGRDASPKAEKREVQPTENMNGDFIYEDIDDGDEVIDLGDEKEQVLAEIEKSLSKVKEQVNGLNGEEAENKGVVETSNQEQIGAEVTLTVAECSEFHDFGEFHKNIPTVDEAIKIWKKIPPERMNGIPAIGINIHTPGTEEYKDLKVDIFFGERIDLDILELYPKIKDNPQAMEVVTELMAKAMSLFPEMEIDGKMSEKMEAAVWEMRMPGLAPVEQLAVEIDRFVHAYYTDLYRENVPSMTENVVEIVESLKQGDTYEVMVGLAELATGETEQKEKAMELFGKLAEYKPLAKVEEMEEQNYNMVDNVLNNGAGEKAQKEESIKGQERFKAKDSLRGRLEEKRTRVAGQGKEQNVKDKQKEI
nr:DUF3849 domain-containing protein [uncultured Acetatifactor sp.]